MENKSYLIKMSKQVITKVEFAKHIISIIINFNNIKLSDTEINILAYFMVYGINNQSKELIVKSLVCKNLANIKTIMVKLKKLDLIYKDDLNGKMYVNKNLNLNLTQNVGFYLKLELK